MSDVILTADGESVTLHGGAFAGHGIALTGLSGWYQTPDAKVTVTSRGQGDGGHDIVADNVMYDARVVTVGYRIIAGSDREEALRQLALLDKLVHRLVTCRVIDDGQDTCCSGGYYVRSLEQKIQNPLWQNLSGDITLVFERPERLSTTAQRCQLLPSISSDRVGLSYGSAARGLAYPLSYGAAAVDARNVCTLTNDGSSRAYPVFTVQGPWPDGVQLTFPGLDMSLDYAQAVGSVPLVLDSRSRTASIGGLDVSRNLRQRGFPTVPPGGSTAVNLQSIGNGYVSIECHDTYM
jgi:hypothetical protein